MKLPVKYSTLQWRDKKTVREAYIKQQGGLCYHCKVSLKQDPLEEIARLPINWKLFPRGFLNYPVHLHHDHNTDLTIGAVHARCNAVLWEWHGE